MTGTGRNSDRIEVQEVSRDPAFASPDRTRSHDG